MLDFLLIQVSYFKVSAQISVKFAPSGNVLLKLFVNLGRKEYTYILNSRRWHL